jgi:23S rRNA (uridine2552-2'-O)-methyltransferase
MYKVFVNDKLINITSSSKKENNFPTYPFDKVSFDTILDKFKKIRPKQGILDIGAAPGSWLQVISKKFPHNNIVAVDLLDIEPFDNVSIIKCDIYLDSTQQQIFEHSNMFDLVLCDIAPNTIGHSATDHLRLMDIAENVLELSLKCLNKDGTYIIKLFDGALKQQYQKNIQAFFDKVSFFKPKSSRKESKEIYLIALNRNSHNPSFEQ